MQYTRIGHAAAESVSGSLADNPLIELSIPSGVIAEILRVEISPNQAATAPDPTPFQFYTTTGAGSGGTAITEQKIRGDGTLSVSALHTLSTKGAGVDEYSWSALQWDVGFLYLPVPEERFLIPAAGQDFFGVCWNQAVGATVEYTVSVVWGEIAV